MSTALIIVGLILIGFVVTFAMSLAKISARSDHRATILYQEDPVKYVGGTGICRTCGEVTYYSDDKGPVHPGKCREES